MIPLIAALIPLVPAIVQGIEKLFGSGKGAEKKDAAVSLVDLFAQKLGGGQTPPELAQAIPGLVEWVVQQLKAKGELQSSPAPQPAVSGPGLASSVPNFSVPFSITGTIRVGQ
jgi:hypothetical protein